MSFYSELKRRNVIRVGVAYAAVAWLVIQVVETLFPVFGLSDAAIRVVVILLAVGFLPALIAAWALEFTPDGLKRDRDAEADSTDGSAKSLDRVIMVVLAVAVAYFAVDRFLLAPQREAAQLATALDAARSAALAESYGDKSIAVLPFADLSPQADQAYFSDGMAEELLNLLAKLDELRVISRSSAFALRDASLSIPEVAEKLDVSYVLEGSVRKAGERIRITAQLIEARSDTHLWSETYDRTLDDVFAVQDEISARVVEELKLKLLGQTPVARVTSPQVFELVLRGRHAVAQRDRESLDEAVMLFEQAIARDPDYAPAHGGLAKVLALKAANYSIDPASGRRRAEAALDRALALDPGDSDALATKGMLIEDADPAAAHALYERAIDANPNNSDAYRWLAISASPTDPERYLEYLRRGRMVDPLNQGMNYHWALALSRFGRYDEALAAARTWRELDPGFTGAYAMAGEIHARAGQWDGALESYYAAYRKAPDAAVLVGLPWLLMDLGDLDLAAAWVDEARRIDPDDSAALMQQVVVSDRSGRRDRSLQLIAETAERHPRWWAFSARMNLLVADDFERARREFERGLESEDLVRDWNWTMMLPVDYILSLARTGAAGRAEELTDEALALLERQMAAGMVSDGAGFDLRFFAAQLLAMRGAATEATALLREDASAGGLSCVACLGFFPHFDRVRGEPAFDAFVAEQREELAARRERLAAAGLLLTPAEVLARGDVDFDPFLR